MDAIAASSRDTSALDSYSANPRRKRQGGANQGQPDDPGSLSEKPPYSVGDTTSDRTTHGNAAFALSRGSCGTTPSASSSGSRFSDMLLSPPAFAFRSIG